MKNREGGNGVSSTPSGPEPPTSSESKEPGPVARGNSTLPANHNGSGPVARSGSEVEMTNTHNSHLPDHDDLPADLPDLPAVAGSGPNGAEEPAGKLTNGWDRERATEVRAQAEDLEARLRRAADDSRRATVYRSGYAYRIADFADDLEALADARKVAAP